MSVGGEDEHLGFGGKGEGRRQRGAGYWQRLHAKARGGIGWTLSVNDEEPFVS